MIQCLLHTKKKNHKKKSLTEVMKLKAAQYTYIYIHVYNVATRRSFVSGNERYLFQKMKMLME